MSVERVLAAAAVLRRFSLPEIAAYCDEPPSQITIVLTRAAPDVEADGVDQTGAPCWRVVDRAGLRRRISVGPRASTALPTIDGDRLRYVEETFVRCGGEPSADRRGVLVATAVNHLRHVLARDLPGSPSWWKVG